MALARAGATGTLLYVTGDTKSFVYTYPALKPAGTISGFHQSQGACSDAKGDVWIADYGAQEIKKYAHGSTKSSTTLKLPNFESPAECAVDAAGDLAVSAWRGGSGPGYVLIYKGGKGTPRTITDSKFVYAMFLAYDKSANLYLDGTGANNAFEYAEMAKGKTAFSPVALKQHIGYPGGLQYDGKYIAIGDQEAPVIYRTSGTKVIGKVNLGGGSHTIFGFVIDGGTLICTDNGGTQAVETYKYPAGGNPTNSISVVDPAGIALSR